MSEPDDFHIRTNNRQTRWDRKGNPNIQVGV
jgi:hypothetical protein